MILFRKQWMILQDKILSKTKIKYRDPEWAYYPLGALLIIIAIVLFVVAI